MLSVDLASAAIQTGPLTYKGHSYYILAPQDPESAELEAQSLGGHLVTIDDAAENAFIVGQLSSPAWIGRTDYAEEGNWSWRSGSSSTYTKWATGYPRYNEATKNCALIQNLTSEWADDSCGFAGYPSVAEIAPIVATPIESVDADSASVFQIDSSPGGGDLRFRIVANDPGQPTGIPLRIENELDTSHYPGVGVWQPDPLAPLDVGSHDGMSARLLVRNQTAPTAAGDVAMFQLTNPGSKIVRFQIATGPNTWTFDNDPACCFRISKLGTGVAEFTVDGGGNGRFFGQSFAVSHVNTSSRTVKAGFEPVDGSSVLEKVASLPITRWYYRMDAEGAPHVGPVAEEFQAAFGLGDGMHIDTVDADGVALAAIQGLHQLAQQQRDAISGLERGNALLKQQNATLKRDSLSQVSALAERLAALEHGNELRPARLQAADRSVPQATSY